MDFSLKQALPVVIVIAVFAIVIGAGVIFANENSDKTSESLEKSWKIADDNLKASESESEDNLESSESE